MVLNKRILTKGKNIVRSLKKNKMNRKKRKVRTNSKNLNKKKIRTLAKIQKGGNYKLKLNNARQSGGGENFTLMTYNVFHGDRYGEGRPKGVALPEDHVQSSNEYINNLEDGKPDIICTQENDRGKVKFNGYKFENKCPVGNNTSEDVGLYIKTENKPNVTFVKCIEEYARHAIIFDYKNIKIANLHLAGGRHIDKKLHNEYQIKYDEKMKLLQSVINENPDIILGDFNSVWSNNEGRKKKFLDGQINYLTNLIDHETNDVIGVRDDPDGGMSAGEKITKWNIGPYELLKKEGYTYAVPDNETSVATNFRGNTIVDTIWYKGDKVNLTNTTIKNTMVDAGHSGAFAPSDHNPITTTVTIQDQGESIYEEDPAAAKKTVETSATKEQEQEQEDVAGNPQDQAEATTQPVKAKQETEQSVPETSKSEHFKFKMEVGDSVTDIFLEGYDNYTFYETIKEYDPENPDERFQRIINQIYRQLCDKCNLENLYEEADIKKFIKTKLEKYKDEKLKKKKTILVKFKIEDKQTAEAQAAEAVAKQSEEQAAVETPSAEKAAAKSPEAAAENPPEAAADPGKTKASPEGSPTTGGQETATEDQAKKIKIQNLEAKIERRKASHEQILSEMKNSPEIKALLDQEMKILTDQLAILKGETDVPATDTPVADTPAAESMGGGAILNEVSNSGVPGEKYFSTEERGESPDDRKNQCLWISISDWFRRNKPDAGLNTVTTIKEKYCKPEKPCNGNTVFSELGPQKVKIVSHGITLEIDDHRQFTREALQKLAEDETVAIRIFYLTQSISKIDLSGLSGTGTDVRNNDMGEYGDFYDKNNPQILNDHTNQIWITASGGHFQLIDEYKFNGKLNGIDYNINYKSKKGQDAGGRRIHRTRKFNMIGGGDHIVQVYLKPGDKNPEELNLDDFNQYTTAEFDDVKNETSKNTGLLDLLVRAVPYYYNQLYEYKADDGKTQFLSGKVLFQMLNDGTSNEDIKKTIQETIEDSVAKDFLQVFLQESFEEKKDTIDTESINEKAKSVGKALYKNMITQFQDFKSKRDSAGNISTQPPVAQTEPSPKKITNHPTTAEGSQAAEEAKLEQKKAAAVSASATAAQDDTTDKTDFGPIFIIKSPLANRRAVGTLYAGTLDEFKEKLLAEAAVTEQNDQIDMYMSWKDPYGRNAWKKITDFSNLKKKMNIKLTNSPSAATSQHQDVAEGKSDAEATQEAVPSEPEPETRAQVASKSALERIANKAKVSVVEKGAVPNKATKKVKVVARKKKDPDEKIFQVEPSKIQPKSQFIRAEKKDINSLNSLKNFLIDKLKINRTEIHPDDLDIHIHSGDTITIVRDLNQIQQKASKITLELSEAAQKRLAAEKASENTKVTMNSFRTYGTALEKGVRVNDFTTTPVNFIKDILNKLNDENMIGPARKDVSNGSYGNFVIKISTETPGGGLEEQIIAYTNQSRHYRVNNLNKIIRVSIDYNDESSSEEVI